jgi:hypothetical protein
LSLFYHGDDVVEKSAEQNLRPDSFDFSGKEGGAFPEFLNQK